MARSSSLLVVRHGESEWNAAGRWQGQADPPLTDVGRKEAELATEQLGTFDAIWSSPLQRAVETAAIFAAAMGVGPVMVDDRLMETHVGPWEGLTMAEVEAGWPGYLADHRRPDGAEELTTVVARVTECWHDIAATSPAGVALVVAHAGLLRTVRRALGATDHRFANLSGCWFHIGSDARITVGEEVSLIPPARTGDAL